MSYSLPMFGWQIYLNTKCAHRWKQAIKEGLEINKKMTGPNKRIPPLN